MNSSKNYSMCMKLKNINIKLQKIYNDILNDKKIHLTIDGIGN